MLGTHWKCLNETLPMSMTNIINLSIENKKNIIFSIEFFQTYSGV